MTSLNCPICQKIISSAGILGSTAICSCGWHGPTNFQERKRKKKIRKRIEAVFLGLSLLGAYFFYYEWRHWGRFFSNHIVLQAKIITGLTSEEDWAELGIICNTTHHFSCSEKAFLNLLKYKPEDVTALANLAIAQTELGEQQSALLNFEKIFNKGEGSAEAMGYYGLNLERLGRDREAEKWFYRALSQEPDFIDITDHLIDLLVKREAFTEALSVIGNISSIVPASKLYYQSRALTINDLSMKNEKQTSVKSVRIASLKSQHFIPIQFSGTKTPSFFIADSGATYLTVNPKFIADQNITDFTSISRIKLIFAGGQEVEGTLLLVKHIRIGPWQLENIQTAICDDCLLLAGKSVLRLFQTSTKEENGVEYLTLQR